MTFRRAIWAGALLTCFASVSALAQTAAAPAAAPAAATQVTAVKTVKKSDDPDRVICKFQETTGSRLGGHRECRRLQEWQQITRDSQNMAITGQNPSIGISADKGH